ncbi:hypothetical protein JB92DRAFT_3069627 [Gautieria morchelliformis]|nr:hypothetical protein JB92DRAFT_3069627 [Gautieria morchelliformis]
MLTVTVTRKRRWCIDTIGLGGFRHWQYLFDSPNLEMSDSPTFPISEHQSKDVSAGIMCAPPAGLGVNVRASIYLSKRTYNTMITMLVA